MKGIGICETKYLAAPAYEKKAAAVYKKVSCVSHCVQSHLFEKKKFLFFLCISKRWMNENLGGSRPYGRESYAFAVFARKI